ncbi:MAG: hypothetical protein MHM6MM_000098 [Cercozoa sp. M6MM]
MWLRVFLLIGYIVLFDTVLLSLTCTAAVANGYFRGYAPRRNPFHYGRGVPHVPFRYGTETLQYMSSLTTPEYVQRCAPCYGTRVKQRPPVFAKASPMRRFGQHYVPVQLIGSGSFGVVSAVHPVGNSKHLLADKVSQMTLDTADASEEVFFWWREARILRFVSEHFPHTTYLPHMEDMLFERNDDRVTMHLVTTLLGPSLQTHIEQEMLLSSKEEVRASFDTVRAIMFDMLLALRDLHSIGIVHRDITTSNVLITNFRGSRRVRATVIDFGSATLLPRREDNMCETPPRIRESQVISGALTATVTAAWWRAPESLLHLRSYGTSLDIWSLGVVFADLLRYAKTDEFDRDKKPWKTPFAPTLECSSEEAMSQAVLLRVQQQLNVSRAEARALAHRTLEAERECMVPEEFEFYQQQVYETVDQMYETGKTNGNMLPHRKFRSADWAALGAVVYRMLRFDPQDRDSAEELLRSPVFDPVRSYEPASHEDASLSLLRKHLQEIMSVSRNEPNLLVEEARHWDYKAASRSAGTNAWPEYEFN